jgi:hypothetical protein
VNVPATRFDVTVVSVTLPLPIDVFACHICDPINTLPAVRLPGPIVCVPVPLVTIVRPTVVCPPTEAPAMMMYPAPGLAPTIVVLHAVPSMLADIERPVFVVVFGLVGLLLPPLLQAAMSSAVERTVIDV